VLLKACLNGPRRPEEHPALPTTPAALAADVVRVGAAGAGAVHLHVKDDQGVDTLDDRALGPVLAAVRSQAPGMPVGVTTGAWAVPDPAQRVAAVRGWSVRPDFASVNWHEDGADAVALALLDQGVGVEAGLWHLDAVDRWLRSPYRDRCLRVLVELPDGLDADQARREADRLLTALDSGRVQLPVLLHGMGTSTWSALWLAVELGLDTRIGLEDTLLLPNGAVTPDNEALVRAAVMAAGPALS
jgi:uncharacterized protein (DUF849 family)